MTSQLCPACGTATNSNGQALASEWAVACHIAGSVHRYRYRDPTNPHITWVAKRLPDVDFSLPILTLASLLMPEVCVQERPGHGSERELTPLSVLQKAEVLLHLHVKRRLLEAFGDNGEDWWVSGVPVAIRQECALRRESDSARDEPYRYTYFIDLKSIIDKNWALFEADHQRVRDSSPSKRDLLDQFIRLNGIRNRHAHPIRAPMKGTEAYSSDLSFSVRVLQLIIEFCGPLN